MLMNQDEIMKLADRHGLQIKEGISFNEMGIDFKVVFATDLNGKKWVLRIPRRENLHDQIQQECKILKLVNAHLSISVPEWEIVDPELIAYRLLENIPVLTFNPITYEVVWNIDQNEDNFTTSLAMILRELHQIPISEAVGIGIKPLTILQVRQQLNEDIELVKQEIGINIKLEKRWRKWLDNDPLWPDFSTFVHGDLYAGHILADGKGNISGLIDWSEAAISDPSIDFSGHIAVFGEHNLKVLIAKYEREGGVVWKKMFEHIRERHSVSPLKYGVFALRANVDEHIQSAKKQLGVIQ